MSRHDEIQNAQLPVGSGLLVRLMFQAGRQYPKECKQTRLDIDEKAVPQYFKMAIHSTSTGRKSRGMLYDWKG